MYRLICSCCGRDINALGQDNMSYNNYPLCEDCYYGEQEYERQEEFLKEEEPYLYEE